MPFYVNEFNNIKDVLSIMLISYQFEEIIKLYYVFRSLP